MNEVPLQQRLGPHDDLLLHQMIAAYEGATAPWRDVNIGLRDATVDYARRRSPFYRRAVAAGAPFEEIPITSKEAVQRDREAFLAEGVPPERRSLERTSGSTGSALAIYRDMAQQLAHRASADRFARWLHGVPFDATAVTVTGVGGQDRPRFSRRKLALRRLRARRDGSIPRDPWLHAVALVDLPTHQIARELRRWSAFEQYFLIGHASGIEWLASQIVDRALPLPKPPVAVCTTSDMLTEPARRSIEEVFGVAVHSRYGSVEFRWLAPSTPGDPYRYAFDPFRSFVEVLRDDGSPAAPGEVGRLIVTDLQNLVMPLIRYDTGDLAVESVDGYRGGFRLIDGLMGRSSEVLRFPSGRILSGATVGGLLGMRQDFSSWIRAFQCVQTAPNSVELRVVWRSPPDAPVRERILGSLRSGCDPDTTLRLVDITDVDLYPSGKRWLVRRNLD